jgi:hypothetical protein
VPRRDEAGHVRADLGQDALGTAALDAGDRAQQLNLAGERADLLLDHHRQAGDLLVEKIDVREDRSDPQAVVLIEVAGQRLAQQRDLLAVHQILANVATRQTEKKSPFAVSAA